MALRNSDKLQALLLLGELEHSEDKIIYQFVIGGLISLSIAILAGLIQAQITVIAGLSYLIGLWESGIFVFIIAKKRLTNIRGKISEEVKKLEGSK